MNYAALTRFIVYIAAVALGMFMATWGVIHGDTALIATGLALVTTGGVAGANTPVRARHAAPEAP